MRDLEIGARCIETHVHVRAYRVPTCLLSSARLVVCFVLWASQVLASLLWPLHFASSTTAVVWRASSQGMSDCSGVKQRRFADSSDEKVNREPIIENRATGPTKHECVQ